MTSPKFKLGQIVWTTGITIRVHSPTKADAYYLPVKVKIWDIGLELHWDEIYKKQNKTFVKYRILRPDNLVKRGKRDRHDSPITHHMFNGGANNWAAEAELSTSKNDILKVCRDINKNL